VLAFDPDAEALERAHRSLLPSLPNLLTDRGIAPAVHAIHERPEHAWSLGELAGPEF
jgi:hypothetical protein